MSRKRPQNHSNHERWLVSYADFITLLFAFFVVLYSSAQVDKRRIGQLAMAIQGAFQDLGVFQGAPIRGLSHQPSLTKATIANKESMASSVFSASAPSDASA